MTEKIRVVIAEDDVQIAEIQKRFLERIDGVELVGIATHWKMPKISLTCSNLNSCFWTIISPTAQARSAA